MTSTINKEEEKEAQISLKPATIYWILVLDEKKYFSFSQMLIRYEERIK
jgi:hypothetical protein